MTHFSNRLPSLVGIRCLSIAFSALMISSAPMVVLAHGGHGDEFQGGGEATSADSIQVDAETAKRIGLKVEAVTRRRLAFGTQATGQIETLPSRRVEVTNPAGGTLVRLLVQPGDEVQQGQPLAVMTSGELAELRTSALDRQAETKGTVQEAQTNLALAQQTYTRQQQIAQTSIAQAETELRVAQEQYDRDQELTTKGAIARRTLLESEAHLAEAKKALTEAQSRLEVLNAGAERDRAQTALNVAQSRAELSTTTYDTRLQQLDADANADGTITINAPITGRIADREASLGQSAQDAGAILMTIIDDRSVLATANVYEKDLAQVAIGQPVRVKAAGLPDRTFSGEVTLVSAVVEGDTRVIPVKAEIDNADGALKPGMFAEIEVVNATSSEPVLAVPQSALTEIKGQQVVYVQNGGGYQPVEVTLGKTAGDWVEVKSGVFEGDQIVTQRVAQLYAQSLRGGGAAEPDAKVEDPAASSAQPWWVMLSVGGAIAAGAFWIGRKSPRDRRPVLASSNGHNGSNGNNGHIERPDISSAMDLTYEPVIDSRPDLTQEPKLPR